MALHVVMMGFAILKVLVSMTADLKACMNTDNTPLHKELYAGQSARNSAVVG